MLAYYLTFVGPYILLLLDIIKECVHNAMVKRI